MDPGKLRHRVTIQDVAHVQDPVTGSITTSWSNWLENEPASIEPLSVREFIASASQQSEITARIVIRWRPGVLARMRVVHDGTIYAIKGPPLPDKETGRDYLTLAVGAGLTEGE